MKTIIFESKILILHPCIENRVSGRCLSQAQVAAGSSVQPAVNRTVTMYPPSPTLPQLSRVKIT